LERPIALFDLEYKMSKQNWKYEPTDRWIRATKNGETIINSKRAILMIEHPGEQDYYFPIQDVRSDLLILSEQVEKSGYRGQKRFWHLQLGDTLIENAAWVYDEKEDRPDFTGMIAFSWQALDHWYEEDEEIFYHPRNPYHRIDTIKSSRHVEIYVDSVKVADTVEPYFLFETGITTRYYIPEADVATKFLTPSTTETMCPYKGFASYYNLLAEGETIEDAVWVYPDPIPEAPKIKGLLAFWPEKDKRIKIVVDGEFV